MKKHIHNPSHPRYLRKQRGAALMIMLVILVVGATAMMVKSLNSATLLTERNNITSNVLAQAKEGLIGRALTDNNHPGSLPCPDNHAPGSSLEGTSPGTCSVNLIGRLPWKTLGLPDLRDESGERLWYALSSNFRDGQIINSNTVGTLQVYDNSGITLLTPNGSSVAAIIFSPGAIVGTQQRDTANQLLPQNYLETGPNSKNNAVGPFIVADKTSTFNDRLMVITTRDIISMVEKRVNKELAAAFTAYYPHNSNTYPYPANFNCTTDLNCTSVTSICIGKIPVASFPELDTMMPWFKSNNWFDVVYYATSNSTGTGGMGGGGMGGGGAICSAPTVSTVNTKALFILPGIQLNGNNRTSLSLTNMADFFEDSENKNADSVYVTPSASSNDSLHILP